jgi:hypothetical protein
VASVPLRRQLEDDRHPLEDRSALSNSPAPSEIPPVVVDVTYCTRMSASADAFAGIRLGKETVCAGAELADLSDPERRRIEAWLAALLQTEHLSLLIGNGLSMAVGAEIESFPPSMTKPLDAGSDADRIHEHAERSAKRAGRVANFEDEIRTALALIDGYEIVGEPNKASELRRVVDEALTDFIAQVLDFERAVRDGYRSRTAQMRRISTVLQRFLLPFAARAAGRDRLTLFTTNYDRLLEFACDLLGLRLVDRFVGNLEPTFSASRLDIDMHYSPPGIRGEPRLLEGVVRYSKLHGSVDWRSSRRRIVKAPLAFGAERDDPSFPSSAVEMAVIYPNPAKDVETLAFPYSELFRDLAASVCRPNSVLATYGYGFGDSHINRVMADMLTIPSTHLVVISRDPLAGLETFKEDGPFPLDQTTEIIGPLVGSLDTVVDLLPAMTSIGVLEAQADYAERAARFRQASGDSPAEITATPAGSSSRTAATPTSAP